MKKKIVMYGMRDFERVGSQNGPKRARLAVMGESDQPWLLKTKKEAGMRATALGGLKVVPVELTYSL
jgi:hypothetical protein